MRGPRFEKGLNLLMYNTHENYLLQYLINVIFNSVQINGNDGKYSPSNLILSFNCLKKNIISFKQRKCVTMEIGHDLWLMNNDYL